MGTDKLIQRILDEAKADAAKITDDARQKADATAQDAKALIAKLKSDGEIEAKNQENEAIFLAKKNAELEAKKQDLAMRHKVLDEAFSAALSQLRSMNVSQTETFLRKLIFREVSGGEEILPTEKNMDVVKKVIAEVNDLLDNERAEHIRIGDITDAIADGVIIKGAGYIKTCSYEALISDLKERETGKIADILF